jgi:hypothetical protein
MRFEGDQLRAILAYQTDPVVVRDGFGRPEVEYENPRAALSILRRGIYYGVGHRKRIRFIQPDSVEDRVAPWGTEVDFGAPRGAGSHYISVRTGTPKRRVSGAKSIKVVKPGRLTRTAMSMVDAPSEDPTAHIGFGGSFNWQDSPIYRAYGSRPGEWEILQQIKAMRAGRYRCAAIAGALNANHVPTRIRGQVWSRAMVISVLRQRR